MQSAVVVGPAKAKNDDYLPEPTKDQHTLIRFGAKAYLEEPATMTVAVVEIQNKSHGGSDDSVTCKDRHVRRVFY